MVHCYSFLNITQVPWQIQLLFSTQSLNTNSVPPHIAAFGEHGGANDFRSHPGVCPSCAHFGSFMPFPGQAEIRDLQYLVAQISIFHLLEYQYWRRGRGGTKDMQSKASIYAKRSSWRSLQVQNSPRLQLFKHTALCYKILHEGISLK